jgi:hypothetical protein
MHAKEIMNDSKVGVVDLGCEGDLGIIARQGRLQEVGGAID